MKSRGRLAEALERLQDIEKGVSAHGHFINNLTFADDIDVLASNWEIFRRWWISLVRMVKSWLALQMPGRCYFGIIYCTLRTKI